MVTSELLNDRYRLAEKLATGGMGVVYEATDERLGRKVAVKILKSELAQDPTFVERFRREARAAAALSHPNIANVFDYGEEDEHRFIVMELAEGVDLSRLLREEGPLSPERALGITEQVCDALAHAHSAGLIHRDVKPGNIVVGAGDRVKVTDFGIARAVDSSTLTATGMVMGTANYISPEQAQGHNLTPQSDIYSLGVVLYEMVTGSVPFTADSPVAVALRHVNEDLPPASSLNPDVPREVDAIIQRATAKAPAERFADARALRAALPPLVAATEPVPLGRTGAQSIRAADDATETMEQPHGELIGAADDATAALLPFVGPWNTRRLGTAVLITFGVLFALAVAFLIYRVAADEPVERARSSRRQPGAAALRSSASPTLGYTVDFDELIARPLEEVEPILKEKGLDVQVQGVDVEIIEEELSFDDPIVGFVYHVEPPDGTHLDAGDTITLFVASEEKDEGPGNSDRGRGHGKGKDKGEDD
ncbi:MAG: protein kinase [Actinomycetota bacterium]